MFEPITIPRLNEYTDKVKELDKLLEKKKKILERAAGTHGVDYSKIKVTAGNGNKTSEQERCVMALQKVNAEIEFLKHKCFGVYGLLEEHAVIKTQIARIRKWNYRKVLVYRYLEKWKWSEIIQDFFEFEEDYDTEKDGKYKDIVMYWHRRALEELEKVSNKPYLPAENKQLHFEIKKGNEDERISKSVTGI